MRKYQLWQLNEDYAISDFEKEEIDFATQKDFSIKYEIHSSIETELASKQAFLEFLKPLITDYGVHPIFNVNGQKCEQITNVPKKILSSDEILKYLNDFTILPQSTPPYEEIIYKLPCFSSALTEEYIDRISKPAEIDIAKMFLDESEAELDTDVHHFACFPKISEEKKGYVFHLPNPTRAHRKWVILEEHYDWKNNSWTNSEGSEKREGDKIELIDKKKPLTEREIYEQKEKFFAAGGEVTNLNPEPENTLDSPDFKWKELEIHDLCKLIPLAPEDVILRMTESIRLNGCFDPIKIFEGKILDGRTRQGVCVGLGVRPTYEQFHSHVSPMAYVKAMGIDRRHLSPSQIAAYGVNEVLPEIEKEARKRQLSALNNSDVEKVPQRESGRSCELVAASLQTNPKYVQDAKNIKESHPELFEKILSGDLTISAAKKQIKPVLTIKKSKRRKPFEKLYKEMLQTIMDRSEPSDSARASVQILPALKRISDVYLTWNRRNDKRVIKMLEEMKIDFDGIFGEKKEPHLRLLEM